MLDERLKTDRSRRSLDAQPEVVAALRAHRIEQRKAQLKAGALWQPPYPDLVFTTALGTPLGPRNLHRSLTLLTENLGLGPWHPHELRHSAASLMSEHGVPIERIADQLGHDGTRMGLLVYRHAVKPTCQRRNGYERGTGVTARPNKMDRLPSMRVINRFHEALTDHDVRVEPIGPGEVVEVDARTGWRLCRGGISIAMPPLPVQTPANAGGPLFGPADKESLDTFIAAEGISRKKSKGQGTSQVTNDGYVARCPRCLQWLSRISLDLIVVELSSRCDAWYGDDVEGERDGSARFTEGDRFRCADCDGGAQDFQLN